MNTTLIQPYLSFHGRCEEALAFYQSALGAKLQMAMRFKDAPEPPPPGVLPEGAENLIMHAALTVNDALLMMSDGCGDDHGMGGISLSLTMSCEDELRKAFDGLSQGGKVSMPLAQTFWSPLFGSVQDKFGVNWMLTLPVNEGCK